MGWLKELVQSLFFRTEQLVLVPGVIEMTVMHRHKIVMLFVADVVTDESPYTDLEARFMRKGYSLHLFTLPKEPTKAG
jgi:hypothetical protein